MYSTVQISKMALIPAPKLSFTDNTTYNVPGSYLATTLTSGGIGPINGPNDQNLGHLPLGGSDPASSGGFFPPLSTTPVNVTVPVNEVRIKNHLAGKAWNSIGPIPRYGDPLPSLGHHLQLLPGDLCFTYSGDSNNTNPKFAHQTLVADLAKVNEVLAMAYYEIKREFGAVGLGMQDSGNSKRTQKNYGNDKSQEVYIRGVQYRDILSRLYKILDKPAPEDRRKTYVDIISINSLLLDYTKYCNEDDLRSDQVVYGAGKIGQGKAMTDEDSDEDLDLFIPDQKLEPISISNLKYPRHQSIYQKFYKHYPEKNRFVNSMNCFDDPEDYIVAKKNFEDSIENDIMENVEFLEKNYEKQIKSHRARVESIFSWVITEVLGTSQKYHNYCTLFGIINSWNFWGVVSNTGDGMDPSRTIQNRGSTSPMTSIVNYDIERLADVTNRWGPELLTGTKLFIILKKERSNGPYLLIPWYDKTKGLNGLRGYPTKDDMSYLDEDGMTMCEGYVIYIGEVIYTYADNYEEKRKQANGIPSGSEGFVMFSSTALDAKIKIASCGKVRIALRH